MAHAVVCQVPKDYVSAEVCEILSDHLIASSELCGTKTADAGCKYILECKHGYKFVGHPEYIRDERYERNQFMYNVCFVFDAQTDVSAFRPLISKVAGDFRTIEADHRFLSRPETRGRIEEIIGGILSDIKQTGTLRMPPTGVLDIPLAPTVDAGLNLQGYDALLETLPQVQLHEVPVWVAAQSSSAHNICSEYQHSHPFLTQLLPFFTEDGRAGGSDVASIVGRTSLEQSQVVDIIARLVQRDVIRLVDRVSLSNVYVCTSQLQQLPRDPRLRKQCVDYCRSTGAAAAPAFSSAYRILCAIEPSKRLSEVCLSLPPSGGAGVGAACRQGSDGTTANIDVMRLVRFACVHRFIRRIHHWPIWLGPQAEAASSASGAGLAGGLLRRPPAPAVPPHSSAHAGNSKAATGKGLKARSGAARELSARILPLCNGRNCYDAIACALGVTVDEVEDECERGPLKGEIVVMAQMSCDEG